MQHFTQLFAQLDQTRETALRVDALRDYFARAPDADAAWAVYLLKGEKLRRLVSTRDMRTWVAEQANIPMWLLEASYAEVGDLAETLACLWPVDGPGLPLPLHTLITEYLLPLHGQPPEEQRTTLGQLWDQCTLTERLLLNKLISGGFRMDVARELTASALAKHTGRDPALIAHRLMGPWTPTPAAMNALRAPDDGQTALQQPYPFFLASPLTHEPETLGDPDEWQAEWKWNGIRAQLIHRPGLTTLWSRGEALISDSFPEIITAASDLPEGTVLDGEILAWRDEAPLPFAEVQRRLKHRNPSPKLQRDVPVIFLAYDCMEIQGVDIRHMPLYARMGQVLPLFGTEETPRFRVSEPLKFSEWAALANLRAQSRKRGVEGLMLKRCDSPYQAGREQGDWWKWKIDPLTLDAVLIYAQAGHGRRSGLYTDYTLALRHDGQWVPFAKVCSELSDAEMKEVDQFIRANTLEKHGPVRVVTPQLVFEVAFEGLRPSKRHKSGIAVHFPRIVRRRPDKAPEQADTLDALRALLQAAPCGNT